MSTLFVDAFPTPTPVAGGAIPFSHMTTVRDNALALYYGRWSQVDVSATGTVNDYAPAEGCIVRWANGSPLVVTGIVPNQDGEIRIFQNAGGSTLTFTSEDVLSAAANRLTMASTSQWIGGGGAIGLRYDGTSDRWRVLFVEPGAPITPTFAAGNWLGSGSTWTLDAADAVTDTFVQVQRRVKLAITVETSSVVGATAGFLSRALPGGFTVAKTAWASIPVVDNNVGRNGSARVVAAGSTVEFYADAAGTAWAISANQTSVRCGDFEIEVS